MRFLAPATTRLAKTDAAGTSEEAHQEPEGSLDWVKAYVSNAGEKLKADLISRSQDKCLKLCITLFGGLQGSNGGVSQSI